MSNTTLSGPALAVGQADFAALVEAVKVAVTAVLDRFATPRPITISQEDIPEYTGVSAKTLSRLADAGELVGRLKINGRVVYHLATLDAWFRSRTAEKST